MAQQTDKEVVNMLLKSAKIKEDRTRPDSLNVSPGREEKTKPDTSAVVPLKPDDKLKAFLPMDPENKFDQAEPDRGFKDKDIEAVEKFMKKQQDSIKG